MEETVVEPRTRRPFRLDVPDDLQEDDDVTLLLCLHGGGLSAAFQRCFFPAHDLCEKYRLVVATPEAAEPSHRWELTADEAYLEGVADEVFMRLTCN
jgi:poly(3-hydroxybutyrate) depolymerase